MAARGCSLKLLLIASFILLVGEFFSNNVHALNIGAQRLYPRVFRHERCSKTCESSFCKVAPLLRYGKYCGLLYSGCPGQKPCDGLDACCMKHDACVSDHGRLSEKCSQDLIDCMNIFQKSRGRTFKGNKCNPNDVVKVINATMNAALLVGN